MLKQEKIRSLPRRPGVLPAFTLVELLVVLLLLSILLGVALPTIKRMFKDQAATRTAQGLVAYINAARSRAITGGHPVGILIERFNGAGGPTASADMIGRAQSIRVRQLSGMPPYTGDASNSVAILQRPTSFVAQPGELAAAFSPSSNQLLTLSASMVGTADEEKAPIRFGDFLELPGGRVVPIFRILPRPLIDPEANPVRVTFFPNEPDPVTGTEVFPASLSYLPPIPLEPTFPNPPLSAGMPVKYKIHRRPAPSTLAAFDLPRGISIDLNYSGIGVSGNEFAPHFDAITLLPAFDISIVFAADGSVMSVAQSGAGIGTPPIGQIFLCIGKTDGIRPDNLFSQEADATANILNADSVWLVINQNTGRVVASPFATVSSIPPGTILDPTDVSIDTALVESRFLANLSDTLDTQ